MAMVAFDDAPDFDGSFGGDDDDDIARFERKCAERARAQGLRMTEEGYDEPGSDENSDDEPPRGLRAAGAPRPGGGRASGGTASGAASGGASGADGAGEWRQRCLAAEEKLQRRETELSQARADLDLVKSDGGVVAGDVVGELKQRLLDLTKKNRRMQVSLEGEKTRVAQLETELKRPREEARRKAADLEAERTAAALGDGLEDWKQKYLGTSNKLQEVRHEAQELRAQLQRQRKVLLKELGSEDTITAALAVVDDPSASQWRGRAAQIAQLQRQVKDLREQAKRARPEEGTEAGAEEPVAPETPQRQGRLGAPAERASQSLAQAAEKRREEFERLQEETERLRVEAADARRKREALKSRAGVLESQQRELRAHVQTLVQKSEHDDELVAALRLQLGREAGSASAVGAAGASAGGGLTQEAEQLRREKEELQAQLERQAQIVLQLKQKSLAAAYENGAERLGPRSVEGGTSDRTLVSRVRYLEAENLKYAEQVRLYRGQAQLGSKPLHSGRSGRSCSEDSTGSFPQDGGVGLEDSAYDEEY